MEVVRFLKRSNLKDFQNRLNDISKKYPLVRIIINGYNEYYFKIEIDLLSNGQIEDVYNVIDELPFLEAIIEIN